MTQRNPVEVVNAWVAAANARDAGQLAALSDPNIEVAGPRGSGFGHQLLREWLARAGLTTTTLRAFSRGDTVVLEQRAVWRSVEAGDVTGEHTLASLFRVSDERVATFARFDTLGGALAAAGLGPADEVSS